MNFLVSLKGLHVIKGLLSRKNVTTITMLLLGLKFPFLKSPSVLSLQIEEGATEVEISSPFGRTSTAEDFFYSSKRLLPEGGKSLVSKDILHRYHIKNTLQRYFVKDTLRRSLGPVGHHNC